MENLANLENALQSFLDKEEIISPLALVLEYDFSKNRSGARIPYREIENLLRGYSKGIIKETLTWAARWRLILPSWRGDFRSLCWGDRMRISTEPEIRYEVLLVVRYLVGRALGTGLWDPEEGVKGVLRAATDLDDELALRIMKKMAQKIQKDSQEEAEGETPCYIIAIDQLKEIFDEVGLTERKESDLWVVELKATDIMSPAVKTLMPGMWGEDFGFELNPSLFVKGLALGTNPLYG